MRVVDVEPMMVGSEVIGVKLTFSDHHKERFTNLGLALCHDGLTRAQIKYIKLLQEKHK